MKLYVGVFLAAISTACGSGDQATPDASTPARECQPRCIAKLTGCGATQGEAIDLCPSICGLSPTESQMRCLEATSCGANIESALDECGIGQMPGSDAGVPSDSTPDAATVCVDPAAIRWVCQCSAGEEVRGCSSDPSTVCLDFCPDATCGNGAVCAPE